ncbi:hypothetical protein SVA_3165 [Sulfurifustis variabilis]|uniref:Zinc resistance-associated protein n=2 Tax=Sulfurifustis variabilis TaxID=1675686 RepID=A0A1C7AEV7_9GAMM|nr:hypothetical protein SVA_3165 [Sulfurifustis variabilis]
MGGWGPGAGYGGCPGAGMMGGPGMMGGMGMMGMMPMMMNMMGGGMGMGGPGMMGPGMMGGMGPGMGMMGPGMGMGMMGGGMMGPGGMGMGPLAMLDLTDDQRAKIAKIQDETRKRQWELSGKLLDEQARLRDLYLNEKPDPKQVGQVYGNVAKLNQQMAEISTEAHNRMFDVLTKEQRDQLSQWRRGTARGFGPGGMTGPGGQPMKPRQ